MVLGHAYIAGLLDGEGCFGIARSKKYFYPTVYLGMTVKALPIMKEIQEEFGGTLRMYRAHTEKWAEAWMLRIHGKATRKLIEAMLPHLELKKNQATLLLELIDHPEKGPDLYLQVRDLNQKGPPRKKMPLEDRGTIVRFAGDHMMTPKKEPDLFTLSGWEQWSGPWAGSGILSEHGELLMLSTTAYPSEEEGFSVCSLAEILEPDVAPKYYLSPKACAGILRRAEKRGKKLPPLRAALTQVAFREPTGPAQTT